MRGVQKSMTDSRGAAETDVDRHRVCYLTTLGRRSRRPHRIEIWFTALEGSLYLVSGGGAKSDWVQNLLLTSTAKVELGGSELAVAARLPLPPSTERDQAIERLHAKYVEQVTSTVEDWHRGAFMVALDLGDGST
jgi:deazaflavin-dependent oxidoreductase (nitroreductase family)